MNVKNLLSAAVVGIVCMFQSVGCNTKGGSPQPLEGKAHAATQAMAGGAAGGGQSFQCSALGCICWGDWDCNNMFGSGVCDGRVSKCYQRGPAPVYCTCVPARSGGVRAGGAAGASKAPPPTAAR